MELSIKLRLRKMGLLIQVLALLLLALAATRCAPPAVAPDELGPKEFVIVSTNDFHAALDRAEGLAMVIRGLRNKYGERMIYLDAGDQFQGSIEGNMSKGKAVVDLFNLLRPAGAAIGNHELDYGADVPERVSVAPGEDGMGNLKRRVREAQYPWLSANIIVDPPASCEDGPRCNALGLQTVFEPRTSFDRAGKRFCIIGATTASTPNITSREFVRGTKFLELRDVVEEEAEWFEENEDCDCVVLLVHEGLRFHPDGRTLKPLGLKPMLDRLPKGTVDIIIGGHSHIRVQNYVNGTPVVQAGSSAQVVATVRLRFSDGEPLFQFGPFIRVPETAVEPDITETLAPYRDAAKEIKTAVVGASSAEFHRNSFSETALGNLVADAILWAGKKYGAKMSLMNAGGIRAGLPAGALTYNEVFRVMPFDNQLAIVQLRGSELIRLLEIAFSGAEGISSVSGLQVKRLIVPTGKKGPWDRDMNGDGKKEEWERDFIVEVKDAAGKPIKPNEVYSLATISYLVQSGDYQDFVYDNVPADRIRILDHVFVRDLLADYFKQHSPLAPETYFSDQKRRLQQVPFAFHRQQSGHTSRRVARLSP